MERRDSGRPAPSSPKADCPSCSRGLVGEPDWICDRCHVAIPQGLRSSSPGAGGATGWLVRPPLSDLYARLFVAFLAGYADKVAELWAKIWCGYFIALLRYFKPFCGNDAAAEIEATTVLDNVIEDLGRAVLSGKFTFRNGASIGSYVWQLMKWRAFDHARSIKRDVPAGAPRSLDDKISRDEGASTIGERLPSSTPPPDAGLIAAEEDPDDVTDEGAVGAERPAPPRGRIPADDPLSDPKQLTALRTKCGRKKVQLHRLLDGLEAHASVTPVDGRARPEQSEFLMTHMGFQPRLQSDRARFDHLMWRLRGKLPPELRDRARSHRSPKVPNRTGVSLPAALPAHRFAPRLVSNARGSHDRC